MLVSCVAGAGQRPATERVLSVGGTFAGAVQDLGGVSLSEGGGPVHGVRVRPAQVRGDPGAPGGSGERCRDDGVQGLLLDIFPFEVQSLPFAYDAIFSRETFKLNKKF